MTAPNTPNDLRQLTLSVCQTARQAARYIAEERTRFSAERIECKHAHDYVSYVDKQSEQLIVAALRKLLPCAGFITEEGTAAYADEQYCWVIDPLDGTTNFIHSFSPYCVSIALCQGSSILSGVVCEVTTGHCYYAWKGGGAWCEDKPIHVGSHQIDNALLCFQLPYNSDAYRPVIQRLIDTFYGRVASIRMIGSAAMALCYVAAGMLDGYAEKYIGQWDYMAGSLIVTEAGGQVTDYSGSADYTHGNSVVATNGLIHQDLLQPILAQQSTSLT